MLWFLLEYDHTTIFVSSDFILVYFALFVLLYCGKNSYEDLSSQQILSVHYIFTIGEPSQVVPVVKNTPANAGGMRDAD